jgi:hypothetical protein
VKGLSRFRRIGFHALGLPRASVRLPRHAPPPGLPRLERSDGQDDPLVDPGRALGLRLLALLGAVSFVILGLSSIAPLLQPPAAPPMPHQRRLPAA